MNWVSLALVCPATPGRLPGYIFLKSEKSLSLGGRCRHDVSEVWGIWGVGTGLKLAAQALCQGTRTPAAEGLLYPLGAPLPNRHVTHIPCSGTL